MSKLRVSVVLATYNGAAHLRQQLDSIAGGTRLPDELVLTDDSSTDDTVGIARAFAATAPFAVRVEPNAERLGFNGNFQRAASLASGDVILFSDQDDVWLPGHVSSLIAPFEADGSVAVAVSNSTYVDAGLRPTGQTIWSSERFRPADLRRASAGWQFPGWVRHRALAGHGMAFRADLRPVVLPFGAGWIFDQWVGLAAAACGGLVILEEPLTLHRQHDRQAVANRQQSLAEAQRDYPALSSDHFTSQIAQWSDLRARLAAHPARLRDPRVVEVLDARIAFLRRRQAMRAGGAIGRATKATVELLRGGYHRSGRGLLTFARDLAG